MKQLVKNGFLAVGLTAALTTSALATTSHSGVTYETKTVNDISLRVVTADIQDPTIGMGMSLANDTIGTVSSFSSIVAEEQAIISINANFFESYTNNLPIGNVMVDGELVYSDSGMPCMGFTESGELVFGIPKYFTHVHLYDSDNKSVGRFLAYDVNITGGQGGETFRVYTNEYGSTVSITQAGTVFYFDNGTFTKYHTVSSGDTVTIPSNGQVVYQSQGAEAWAYPAGYENYIGYGYYNAYDDRGDDEAVFDNVILQGLMAGNSQLVVNGSSAYAMTTYPESAADDIRWTGSAGRTAIGELSNGKLLIVQGTASLQALADAMISLGCINAINIDGGGSVSMAVDGKVITSGRDLATTFHIYDLTGKEETTTQIPSVNLNPTDEETVSLSSTRILVNGVEVSVESYFINNNNYIKLRDLATMVNHTEKNFNVFWNNNLKAIIMRSNTIYESVGGEMATDGEETVLAVPTKSDIYFDGSLVDLSAYLINGNNYLKLRDVMELFDIYVGWDQDTKTATLDTSRSYEN